MYESTNSNGYIAEIAIKKYDASSADVDCGAAATLTPNVLGAYNVDQWSAVSPLTFTATAVNGGELSYQWYQWVDGDAEHGTEATKIEAVGTGAKTNSFTPDVTTATTRHYICIVKEAGCTNEARLNVGTYTVNAASLPDGYCYEWGQGTANTTAPADGNSVNIMTDFTLTNSGASTTSATVYSGSGSLSCLQSGGNGKNIIGDLGGKEIGEIEIGITTTDGSKPTFCVAFASTATFSTSNIINYTSATDQLYVGNAITSDAARSTVSITPPAGTKSFAIARNFSGLATTATLQNSKSRNVWYVKACSANKYSVTYNANGATGGTVPTDSNSPYSENSTVTVLGNTGNLVKTGKSFAGWNSAADGSGATFAPASTFAITRDTTLYAMWEDPCLAPTINGGIGAYTYDQNATATAITISAIANNPLGGALQYHWYQYEMGETPAQRIDAVGTGGNTNSFTPSTATVGSRFFICEVTQTGCAETASTVSGVFTVNKARHPGWVIFDGTFDDSFATGSITYNSATVEYLVNGTPTLADESAKTKPAGSMDFLKGVTMNKTLSPDDGTSPRYLKFTIPEGYKLTAVDFAFGGTGNSRKFVLATDIVTSESADEAIALLGTLPSSGGASTIITGTYTCDLAEGDYYLCGGFGGNWEVVYFELTLAPDPCVAPTINSFTAHDGDVEYGDSFTLSVSATAGDANPLKYEWWYYMLNTSTEHHKLATTTESSYTVTNTGFSPSTDVGLYFFYCIVKSKSCSAQTAMSGANNFKALLCVAPADITISGDYAYLGGQTVTLTATPTGGTGTPSYQWQKYYIADGETDANWHDIDNATSATYTKASCGYGDSGSYRCVVTTGEGCSATSTAYGVHVFSLDGGYGTDPWSQNDITLTSGTTGVATVHLDAGKLYKFKVNSNYGHWYGNGGNDPAWDGSYTLSSFSGWNCNTSGGNIRVYTGPEGDYTFTVDVEHAFDVGEQKVVIDVEYPAVTHPDEGYIYYSNPNGWTNVAAHWWKDGGYDFVSWGDNPWMFTTTICGDQYWYMPKMDGYDRIIFHDPGGSQKTADLTVAAENAGQYYGIDSWNDFTSYTISFDGNGETSGTMSDATVLCGHDITLASNVFERDGATFEGWIADVDVTVNDATVTAGNLISDGTTLQNVTGDITFTAQWEIQCATVDILVATLNAGTNNNLEATGTMGGSGQYYLSSGKKLDAGRYIFVKLANGELQPGDILAFDCAKTPDTETKIYLFTGDKDNNTYYTYFETGTGGQARSVSFTLPADFPSGVTGIGTRRDNTYNGNASVNSLTISRPNCDNKTTPELSVSASPATLCPGEDATLTATATPNTDVLAYKWYKADGTQITGSTNTLTVNPTETTSYYAVAYTNLFGVKSDNITVTPKSVTITAEDEVERTKTLTLTGSGNGTWSVTNGTGTATLSANFGNEVTLTGTAEGTITVSFAYDGCTVSKEITVIPKTTDFCENIPTTETGSSHEFTDGTLLYKVNSSGVIQDGTNFASFSSSCVSGANKYSGGQHFAIKFSKPVVKFIIYAGGSNTSVGSFKHSNNGGTSYSSYGSSDYTFSNTSVSGCLTMTFEATGIGYFPSNELLWIKLGAGRDIYGICILYKETEEFIFENNGNWNTASSWNFGVVPSEVDNVTINATATVNTTGVQCNNLTMGTGSLTIAGTGLLTVNGVLENSDASKLTVNIPGGIAAADYDNARATVNFHSIAKRNAAGDYQWQYIGWPFTHLADVHWPFSGSWLMRYDASTEDWVNLRNGDGVDPFVGHALTQAAEKDFSWTGTLNAPVATTYDMEYPDGEQNWNLFANSWLAPIAVEKMTEADFHNAKAEVYLYNTGSYNEWETSSDFGSSEGQYTTITPGSASTEHLVIPPMQGFFVQTEGTGAQLTLDYERLVMGKAANLTQTTALRAPHRAPAGGETEAIDLMPQSYIKICIRGEHYADQMYILQSDNYTYSYDNGADGKKILGSEAAPQLFAQAEYGDMAVLATPDIDGTLLGFRMGSADDSYTLVITNTGEPFYLTDLVTNTETLVTDTTMYSFQPNGEADITTRFRLNRSTQHGGTTTDIDEGSAGYKVIVREGKVTIWSQLPTTKIQDIRLYDAAGKLLWIESGANKQESGQALEFTLPQQGVYLLRIGSSTHKIVY